MQNNQEKFDVAVIGGGPAGMIAAGRAAELGAKMDGNPNLSGREKKTCADLKKALKLSEQFVGKKIEDIKKELEK
jgi:flavin-dependent dehydrogenase